MAIQFKKDQLYQELKDAIGNGAYPPGYKFPSEKEFAAQLGVSFLTLRSALKRLEAEQLISRLRSRGTFVNEALPAGVPAARRILLLSEPASAPMLQEQDPFYRHFLFGVAGQSKMSELDFAVEPISSAAELLVRFRQREFAGLLWDLPNAAVFPDIETLRRAGVPQVITNRELPGIPSVGSDYPNDIANLVRTLQRLGHRYIALIDVGDDLPVFVNRRQMFLDAIAPDIGDPTPYFISMSGVVWRNWFTHIANHLLRIPQVTAVVVLAQYMMHFTKYLAEFDLSVPEELSVVQWGERYGFESDSPTPYSILSEPRTEVAKIAVEMLRDLLDGKKCEPTQRRIPGTLTMRNGCALPRDER